MIFFYFLVLPVLIIGLVVSGLWSTFMKKPLPPGQLAVKAPARRASRSEKMLVFGWLLLTIAMIPFGASTELYAVLSAFFLFLYVLWIGLIRPTLK
jgi:hypothetical protein